MHEATKPVVVVMSAAALARGRAIAGVLGGELHGSKRLAPDGVDAIFNDAGTHLARLFQMGRPIICLMAAGALVRLLAPHLKDKLAEPPVLAVSEDGASIVPLLGGHRGANDLARRIAKALGGHPAVTTAGDLRFGVALDAPPPGYVLANPEDAKAVMAELVAGAPVRLEGRASWLEESGLPFDGKGTIALIVSEHTAPTAGRSLVYRPKTLVLGLGASRGAHPGEAIELAERVISESGMARDSVALVASIDVKADERAIHAVAEHFGVPARFFAADRLEAEASRLASPSEAVFAEVGCHGVAEGAALAAAGAGGALIVPKMKRREVTAALGRAPLPVDVEATGRARGRLFVVGIGPGAEVWRSPEVSRMVGQATDLVGYSLYLDLLGVLAEGKRRHDYDLGKEEARVRDAMELAGKGRTVALVCSGDAGIYAMATLVFELIDKAGGADGITDAARRIEIAVSPGISALQAAAARAGAPLGHDFCTISLSDLLTPWEDIRRRVEAAARGDFVIAFYNPVSRRRRTQLAYARDRLLQDRPADTPVVLASNLGREGESVRVVPLGQLSVDDVDMLTVVIVGSSQTRTVGTGDGRRWVYTPRGYAGKAESAMNEKQTKDMAE